MRQYFIERLRQDPHFQEPSHENSIISDNDQYFSRGYYNYIYPKVPLDTTIFDKGIFAETDLTALACNYHKPLYYDFHSQHILVLGPGETTIEPYSQAYNVKVGYGDFDGADLHEFDFNHTQLSYELSFRAANLAKANFSKAKFFATADFSGANLENANFTKAKFLRPVNFSKAKLKNADFKNATINIDVDIDTDDKTVLIYELSLSKNLWLSNLPKSIVRATVQQRCANLARAITDQVLGKNTTTEAVKAAFTRFYPREKLFKFLSNFLLEHQYYFDSIPVEERGEIVDDIANLLKISLTHAEIIPAKSLLESMVSKFLQTSLSPSPILSVVINNGVAKPTVTIDLDKLKRAKTLYDIIGQEKLESVLQNPFNKGLAKLTEDPEQAILYFNKVAESSPEYCLAMLHAGNLYLPPLDTTLTEQEKIPYYKTASCYFKKILDKNPDDKEANALLAVCVANLYYAVDEVTNNNTHHATNTAAFFCLKTAKEQYIKLGSPRELTPEDLEITTNMK